MSAKREELSAGVIALRATRVSIGMRGLYLLTEDAEGFFAETEFSSISRDAVPPEIRSTREFRERCSDVATVLRLQLATRYV